MEEQKKELPEEIRKLTYEEGAKLYRKKKLSLVADIVLIVLIVSLALYVVFNVEALKAANNPCDYCQEKTGRACVAPSDVGFNFFGESETSSQTISVPSG